MDDVGNLTAKLTLDTQEFQKGTKSVEGMVDNMTKSILKADIIKGAFQGAINGAVGLAKAVWDLGEQSVKSYANYEQLIGGVETLFKESSDTVIKNAEKAYQTAGMSANQYMDTVTSFSASLIQSTGRGAQQDLEALEKNLDEQYKATKRNWEDRLALVENADAKRSMRRQMEDELEALKDHNKDLLAQAEAANMASVTTEESLAKAAELADKAIIDMADNANKMGTNIEAIQNAYQGFAKQNYTMLDNLKLGYGGTRQEMERLLKDAEKLAGTKFDLSSYADIVEAIHVIQVEMGIAGTTAEEAEKTISGSWNMVKASWNDLLVSMSGGGKGMEEAIGSLVESVKSFASNLIPVVQEVLWGISDLVAGLAPVILDAVPDLIANVLPGLIEAAVSIVYSLIDALPQIIAVLSEAIPDIVSEILNVTSALLEMLMTDGLPMLLQLAIDVLLTIANGLVENLPNLIPALVEMIQYIIETIVINLPMLIEAALQIIMALVTGLMDNQEQLFLAISELIVGGVGTILVHLPEFLEMGVRIVLKIVEGILMAIPNFFMAIGELLGIVDSAHDDVSKKTSSMQSSIKQTSISISDFNKESQKSTFESAQKITRTAEDTKSLVTGSMNALERTFEHAQQVSRGYFYELNNMIENAINRLNALGNVSVTPKIDPSNVVSACNSIVEACNRAIAALERLASQGGGSFGGGHASGGWVEAGTTYLVGELGPELITPTRSGYVHTADETADILGASSGLSGGITINIQGDVYDDERSMRNKLRDAMLSVLQEQVAYA